MFKDVWRVFFFPRHSFSTQKKQNSCDFKGLFYSTLQTRLEATSLVNFVLHLITDDWDIQIQNIPSLLSNFTYLNYYILSKYNTGRIYPWSNVYSNSWRKEVKVEISVGVTNTLLGDDEGVREKRNVLFKNINKNKRKNIVMSPIRLHTGIILNHKRNSWVENKTVFDVLYLCHSSYICKVFFFPCIKYFFKFLQNVTNINIYFYKGSSGQNVILPEGNQMFSIFKVMSVLIKAVANLSFRGWSSGYSFFY